jgi:hypothetical protein
VQPDEPQRNVKVYTLEAARATQVDLKRSSEVTIRPTIF